MLGIDLVAQLVAAAVPLPGQKFAEARAERHRGEERERGVLAGMIAGRGPARFDRTLGDRVEALERRDERARLEELYFEPARRHALDVLGEAHSGSTEMRELASERALHLPAHAFLGGCISDSRREAQGRDAQRRRCYQRQFRHTDRHESSSQIGRRSAASAERVIRTTVCTPASRRHN